MSEQKQKRGFALFSPEKLLAASIKGGKANTNRYKWTSRTARAAGRLGGLATRDLRRSLSATK